MATTRNVYGICDVCGFRYKLRELKKNSYGLMVCSVDYDGKYDLKNHPQNKQKNVFDDENVTFSSVSEEDGSKQYVLKIDDKTTVFFDAETGLKTKQVTMAPTPEGSISPQPTIYEEYRDVDGILFPHLIKIPLGPQTLEFNTKEIQLNPAISDSDFN